MIKNKKIALASLLAALAVILGGIDNLIPTPAPGVRLGLGNITVLLAIYFSGYKSAVIVALLKVFLCSTLFGSPTVFLYSLSGAVLSLLAMIAAKKMRCFSVVGVSIIGGIFHNLGQLICAYFLVGKGAIYYIPVLCASGCIAGVLTGIVAGIIIKRGRGLFGKK